MKHNFVVAMGIYADIGDSFLAECQCAGQNASGMSVSCDPVNGSVGSAIEPCAMVDLLIGGILSYDECEHSGEDIPVNHYISLLLGDIFSDGFGGRPILSPLFRVTGEPHLISGICIYGHDYFKATIFGGTDEHGRGDKIVQE